MKHTGILWIALCCVLCLLLWGCSGEPPAPVSPLSGHSGNYTATLQIVQGEFSCTATISQSSPDNCDVAFQSPEHLKDMAYLFHRDGVEVTRGELRFQFDGKSLPEGALPQIAVSALASGMRDQYTALTETPEGVELQGIADAGTYTLLVDSDSGVPLKLSLPAREVEIEFQNFIFLD